MHPCRAPAILSFALAAALAGCGRGEPAPAADGNLAAAAAQPAAPVTACALVSDAEMATIVGGPVHSTPDEGSTGKTQCIYRTPGDGPGPYVELSVEWGSGEGAMQAFGMLGGMEPGLTDPYEGIGDQAVAMGPMLAIRTGDDLVSIVLSGVDDTPAAARRIFDTARARM